MAVHKRSYKPYEGRITPGWSRFFVLSRYSLEKLLQGRIMIGILIASYIPMLICSLLVYLHHNMEALAVLRLPITRLTAIDSDFFFMLMSIQSLFAFFLTAYAGPGLISPDLANNALPLYLCRPISRTEYVLGKMGVLFVLLSVITWVPGLFLFFMQVQLAGADWWTEYWHIGPAIFIGSSLWIVFLSLLALALSAWVKWRLAASGLLFGVFFVLTAFGEAINEVMRTKWGHAMSIGHLMGSIWMQLFQSEERDSIWGIFNLRPNQRISAETSWVIMAVAFGICIWILNRRLQAREVVR